ncbi:MAG: OapA family protein [Cellvibrionaceae bacterium]
MKAVDLITRFYKELHFKGFPKSHALAIGALGSSLLLFSSITPSDEPTQNHRQEQHITLSLADSTQSELTSTTIPVATRWHTETVASGDNLSLLFNRAGLPDTSMHELINSHKSAKQLTRLHPGQKFKFEITEDSKLQSLWYKKDRLNTIKFTRTADGFEKDITALKPDVHAAYREATIINSLFLAGTDVGMEESLIMELASIFGWDVDFALDIRANDHFKVLYEEHFLNGEKLRNGAILAAEFTNQGKTFRAVRYTDSKGNSNYYTPEGKSMRKAFLRTPVDFARISSHFNLKRRHPILNKIRAHKGTDYAAPTGTPIKAAGDGRVTFAGTKGGYGRTVVIQHGQSYKTLYAHMHKYGRGIKNGKRVKQGQIIGYVGSSGLATGPHLHYEFYLNGAVRNPVRVPLPKAKSIAKSELQNFKLQTQPIVAKLEEYGKGIQVALSDSSETNNN